MVRNEKIVHGGDLLTAARTSGLDQSELVDFSANINPLGLAEDVRAAIIAAIDQSVNYPDPLQRQLRAGLASHSGLAASQIACGNGAADLIFRAVRVCQPQLAYLALPTFSEYERALKEVGSAINYYQLPEDEDFVLGQDFVDYLEAQMVLEEAGQRRRMLFLCQPNNPTGHLIQPDIMAQLADLCQVQQVSLLVDESFVDFLNQDQQEAYSLISRLARGQGPDHDPQEENLWAGSLMILRSLTKYHALPGLRLGYLATNPGLAAAIRDCGQPWPLNNLAEAAMLAILDRQPQEWSARHKQLLSLLDQEKERLSRTLGACGFRVLGGSVNYLFFAAPGRPDLADLLVQDGVLIRSCANYPGLGPGYFRIAIRTSQENERLIKSLQTLVGPG